MRRVSLIAGLVPLALFSCNGGGSGPAGVVEMVGAGGAQAGAPPTVVSAPQQGGGAGMAVTGTLVTMAGAGGMTAAAGTATGGGNAGSTGTTSTGTAGMAGNGGGSGAAPTGTMETGGAGGSGGESSAGGMTSGPECTDIPDPEQTCATRLEWGNCEQQWLIDGGYCNATCGRCEAGGGSGGTTSDGGSGSGNTGNTGAADTNNYTPIQQGGQGVVQGNTTRYWDCCKQSCGWSANASMPVDSCDRSNNNTGVNDMDRNICFDNGNATTCHGMAPIATDKYSYGYAAANGAQCGSCWQLQFTGSSSNGGNDAGSAAINGKIMIVMATNIGDLNGPNHFDLLIPGGGVGLAGSNACTTSLGISEQQLGAERGGFLATCASSGDHNAKKQCVRNMCDAAFANWPDLKAGCDWYVDWFEIADNPNYIAQQVDCPQQLREFN
jgi:hypothetical protein